MSGRHALLIGSYEYASEPSLTRLAGPENDIAALSAVLADPAIGAFNVRTSINQAQSVVMELVESFLDDRDADDVVLLYFSGHGVKAVDGDLYFAMSNTRVRLLNSTAIRARIVHDLLRSSGARQQILVLDCCYSGAFARGMVVRSGASVDTVGHFEAGRGHAVLTASDAIQYAFENENFGTVVGAHARSVFTSVLVEGLRTGDADSNRDGRITVDELYNYVHKHVRNKTPHQTPCRWTFGEEGSIEIARVPGQRQKPAPLPRELLLELGRSQPLWVRKAAVKQLETLLFGEHVGLAAGARVELERLAQDDSQAIEETAREILLRNTKHQGSSPAWRRRSEADAISQPARHAIFEDIDAMAPRELADALSPERPIWVRQSAVDQLEELARTGAQQQASTARAMLERLASDDDSKTVRAAAARAIANSAALPQEPSRLAHLGDGANALQSLSADAAMVATPAAFTGLSKRSKLPGALFGAAAVAATGAAYLHLTDPTATMEVPRRSQVQTAGSTSSSINHALSETRDDTALRKSKESELNPPDSAPEAVAVPDVLIRTGALQCEPSARNSDFNAAEAAFARTEWYLAQKAMKDFIACYRDDAGAAEQRLQAYARSVEVRAALHQTTDAALKDMVLQYSKAGLPGGSAAADHAARVHFALVDESVGRSKSIRIAPEAPVTMKAFVEAVKSQIESGARQAKANAESYEPIMQYRSLRWTVAALERQGLAYDALAFAILNVPFVVPADMQSKMRGLPESSQDDVRRQVADAIQQLLDQQVRPIECLAIARYALALRAAQKYGIDNLDTRAAHQNINSYGDERIAECMAQAAEEDRSLPRYRSGEFARVPTATDSPAKSEPTDAPDVKGHITVTRGEKLDGSGEFDSNLIVQVVRSRLRAIQMCYEQELRRNPTLAGTVKIEFTVQPRGNVTGVRSTMNSTGDDAVAKCVVNVVSLLRFVPGPKGDSVTYSYPFVFAPQD